MPNLNIKNSFQITKIINVKSDNKNSIKKKIKLLSKNSSKLTLKEKIKIF